jgi:hypothetical protein
MANRIRIKSRDPLLNEFPPNDIVINTHTGKMFFRTQNKLHVVTSNQTGSSDVITGVGAGAGLSGGGTLGGDPAPDSDGVVNLAIGQGSGMSVAADSIALDLTNSVTVGSGLDIGGATTLNLDLTEVGFGGGANRVVTDDGDGTVSTEANLTFNGSVLDITGGISASQAITAAGNISGSTLCIGPNSVPLNRAQILHAGADGDNGLMIVRNDTTVYTNNLLGGIGFDSRDGNVPSSILQASAFIAGYASQNHSTTDKGGYLAIGVSPKDQYDDTTSTKYVHFYKAEEELTIDSVLDKTAYSYMCRFNSTDSSENNVKVIAVQKNGADALLIYSDGDVLNANNSYGSLSDVRFKTNIVDLKDDSLDKILQLRPVSFNWNEESGNDRDRYMVGYIAQEVEKVLPNIVDTHDNSGNNGLKDEKSINHPHLIPYLVKSIQQLSAKIDKLEKQLKNK